MRLFDAHFHPQRLASAAARETLQRAQESAVVAGAGCGCCPEDWHQLQQLVLRPKEGTGGKGGGRV